MVKSLDPVRNRFQNNNSIKRTLSYKWFMCIHTHTHTHTHIVELALNEVGLHYTEYLGKSGFIWFL